MPYAPAKTRPKKARTVINVHQNKYDKGYISTYPDSRRPTDSLADMTNMEITLDTTPRPRPPLVRYGTQPANTVIGRGNYRWNGVRGLMFMMNVGGVGKVYYQTDGGTFNLIGGSYSVSAYWTGFCQSSGRVYVYNGTDNLSYIDLNTMTIISYTALTTPSAPTLVAKNGMAAGNTFTQYYGVTANNAVGESIGSGVLTVPAVKVREAWISGTDSLDLTWAAVTGATSYTVYTGDKTTALYELFTVTVNSYRDDGSAAINPFKQIPTTNSTQGAVFNFMYSDPKNSQVYGVDNNNNLYYSAPGTGDFSGYNGGGSVAIDYQGDTQLNYVTGFRTGKGDPVITVSSRGAAGKGLLNHVTWNTITAGQQSIIYPEVLPANGMAGTYAPRCTIRANDSITYPTGLDIQSTGTSQNIVNILTNNSVAAGIVPDLEKLNLQNLYKACGVEHEGRLYFCMPVNNTSNNEIWYMDMRRKGLWVMRWPVAVTDIWLYEDNNGYTHLCILRADNLILEFTRAGTNPHTDDGAAFTSRVAFNSLVWDVDGITMANIRHLYAKLLQPKGTIGGNAYGLTRKGISSAVGSATYITQTTFTGIGQWDYSGNYQYGDDPGQIDNFGKPIAILKIKPKGLLNQLDWEIVCSNAGCDYFLSTVNTRGIGHPDLIYNG